MDENMKYYQLSGDGINANIVVACKPDEVEKLFKKYEGYTLTETECPKEAHIVSAEPNINPAPFMLHDYYKDYGNPFVNVKTPYYDTPTCARCKNRFKHRDFCDKHCTDSNCWRFNLEK